MSKHLKRKNAGLLYEFLVRTVSRALVEGDTGKSARALKVLRRHFKPGTELYREFRLINALVRTSVLSESVASSILSEARVASCKYDLRALESQKQALIRDIVGTLKDDGFFDQQVDEYKAYATAQVLLNEWRKQSTGAGDIGTIALFEDTLVRWLMSPKDEPKAVLLNNESAGTNRVLMRVMMKKLNEKYVGALLPEQVKLLRSYAFSSVRDDPRIISSRLEEVKVATVGRIDSYTTGKPADDLVVKKLTEARSKILDEDVSSVDDGTVSRFMVYIKLCEELGSEDE